MRDRLALPHSGVSLLFLYYFGGWRRLFKRAGSGRAARRYGEHTLLLLGLTATALRLVLLATANRLGTVPTVPAIVALETGLAMPSLSSLVSRSARADEQGAALGAFQGISTRESGRTILR